MLLRRDLAFAAVAFVVIVASGGTAIGALAAIGSVAGGALAASMAVSAFQGGDFWTNVGNNFHSTFRIGVSFLALSADYDAVFGQGVWKVGGNGLQGYVESTSKYINGANSGLTIGTAATFDNMAIAGHEFGHTLQFIGLSALSGAAGAGQNGAGAAYLGLGAWGAISPTGSGAWWENMATAL